MTRKSAHSDAVQPLAPSYDALFVFPRRCDDGNAIIGKGYVAAIVIAIDGLPVRWHRSPDPASISRVSTSCRSGRTQRTSSLAPPPVRPEHH